MDDVCHARAGDLHTQSGKSPRLPRPAGHTSARTVGDTERNERVFLRLNIRCGRARSIDGLAPAEQRAHAPAIGPLDPEHPRGRVDHRGHEGARPALCTCTFHIPSISTFPSMRTMGGGTPEILEQRELHIARGIKVAFADVVLQEHGCAVFDIR